MIKRMNDPTSVDKCTNVSTSNEVLNIAFKTYMRLGVDFVTHFSLRSRLSLAKFLLNKFLRLKSLPFLHKNRAKSYVGFGVALETLLVLLSRFVLAQFRLNKFIG